MKKILLFKEPNVLLMFVMSIVFSLTACSKSDGEEVVTPPKQSETYDLTFPVNLLIDSERMIAMQNATSNVELQNAVSSKLLNPAQTALSAPVSPITTLKTSEDWTNVNNQGKNCKLIALRWLYTFQKQPLESKVYLDKTISTLLAWVNAGNTAASPVHTPNETAYMGFYEAYSIVRSRMSTADRGKVDNWLKARAVTYKNFPARDSNWETIRLNLLYYFGYILEDTTLLNQTNIAYATHLNNNLLANGQSEDLIKRDAFAYHAYNLSFFARILRTKYMYEGATAYETFKAKKNSIQVSLQDMINYWKPFVLDPANNVHLEFVNTEYEPDKNRSDYNKPYNPQSSSYAFEELVFCFDEAKEFIAATKVNGNRYNASINGLLNW